MDQSLKIEHLQNTNARLEKEIAYWRKESFYWKKKYTASDLQVNTLLEKIKEFKFEIVEMIKFIKS